MAVSRQQFGSKNKPIDRILLLPQVSKMLVLSAGTVKAYILPELSPANIGRIKDVHDVRVDYDELKLDSKAENYTGAVGHVEGRLFASVTVFTSKSIRLIRVFDDSIKLVKDINYPDTLHGIHRGNLAAVGTQTNYDLIDLDQGQKIPLFPSNQTSPIIVPFGSKEFLLACGTAEGPAMGMVVDSAGEITRGTFPWPEYPNSVEIDYPYLIGSFGSLVRIYSIHDQKLVQEVKFTSEVKVQGVSHLFKAEDEKLKGLLEKTPLIYQSTPEEVQKIAEESDQHYNVVSSLVVYEQNGKSIQLFQLLAKPSRLLDIYFFATRETSLEVFDEIWDEYRNPQLRDETEKLFILHLLGLLSLKFSLLDQCFDIWGGFIKQLDPRILLYALNVSKEEIFGSVWIFKGLVDELDAIRATKELASANSEFLALYLSTFVSEITDQSVLKSIELYSARQKLDTDDFVPFLADIKFCQNEIIELLLSTKNYFYLAKFYDKLGNQSQFLYYWKKLIIGELNDARFKEEDPLDEMIKYLLGCDQQLIRTYGEWLLETHPEYALKLFMDSKLQHHNFNDAKILQLLDGDQKKDYLSYMVTKKGEKQFLGDLILCQVNELVAAPKMDTLISSYSQLPIPKLTFDEYLELEQKRGQDPTLHLHNQIYHYLLQINKDTMSILDHQNVVKKCHQLLDKLQYPLLVIALEYKLRHYEEVITLFLQLEDFKSSEAFASSLHLAGDKQEQDIDFPSTTTCDALQMMVFGRYLEMNRPELIEQFLSTNNVFQDLDNESNWVAKMDKFVKLLNKVPDTFPVCRLATFLVTNLTTFQDNVDETVMCRNLSRALCTSLRDLKK
ncbi:hypothetical protein OGAPHI_002399 [Ogataea philodendri]|uniref:CNH domain-containing protein n=1 Tax=Ogataea philodendri TaxID=1378263 RepID=A0A9P8T7Y6_9ASCO|nr:uncharacterized protein OGAPHI_002399 [Ogataea philodendri]KAH3668645.1 hypothetical protein OGAPHI_002399 [Ogataea philodendri]